MKVKALRQLWSSFVRERVEPRISRGPIAVEINDEATIVADATYALRNTDLPLWRDLRARLDDEGIDPRAAVVADSYDIAPFGTEAGIVVGRDGRVVRYRYDDEFTEWSEITDTWRSTGDDEAQYIEEGFRRIDEEQSAGT